MSSFKAIGGYFELELPERANQLHNEVILVNSGRNSLEYSLRLKNAKKLYVPKYACEAIIEPPKKMGIEIEFYSINQVLELAESVNVKAQERLLYINYFGIKNRYSNELANRYGHRLILDCSQAFYYKSKLQSDIFYSPRKFFGVPDGGMLSTKTKQRLELEKDKSFGRMSHLIKRIDQGAELGYEDFKKNEQNLKGLQLMSMSNLTKNLLKSIDYELCREIRNNNFFQLHDSLGDNNMLKLDINDINGPMVYPFMIEDDQLRKKLIDNKVYIATYWPNVFEWTKEGDFERELASKIIPLPVDQRYDKADMKRILEVIL